ncbi:MAG TPA: class I SAM-dependent methyltransferase, partial [Chitinophagaceae bacterium]|nr:class I SAM-dependent methyltransferase [Chitinophagaceae bacterium]
AENIAAYYKSTAYVSHSDTKKGFINRLYHLVRNHTLRAKRKLVEQVTGLKKADLLDVGAGTGAFANAMQKAGWKVTGLEPDENARQVALNKYSLHLQSTENLFLLNKEQFDAITLWHVLEHVHDLHAYLEKFHSILKPDGKLLIAVPNYTSFDADIHKEHWAAYDVPRHLYHFSPKSIQMLAKAKGFTVKDYKPMWFDSFYVSMLSEQHKNGRGNLVKALKVGLLSNMKTTADHKKCSSVIYVLAKN